MQHSNKHRWFWHIRGGFLLGSFVSESPRVKDRTVNLGPATSFEIGFEGQSPPMILIESVKEETYHLEIVEVGDGLVLGRRELARASGPMFPHFIYEENSAMCAKPAWLQEKNIRVLGEKRKRIPDFIHRFKSLSFSGHIRRWTWSFKAGTIDDKIVVGFLEDDDSAAWEVDQQASLFASALSNGQNLYLVVAVTDDSKTYRSCLVSRKWSQFGQWGNGSWSDAHILMRIYGDAGSLWGALSGCRMEAAKCFWVDPRSRATLSMPLRSNADAVARERLHHAPDGSLLRPVPVRVRGSSCSVNPQGLCMSHTAGLLKPRIVTGIGPGCDRIKFAFDSLVGERKNLAPPLISKKNGKLSRLSRALRSAIRDVERLRCERDELQKTLRG